MELNSIGSYQSSGKEEENCCFVFPSSTKREIRHYHVVVVQRRQRNVQKSVKHVQSCCFANLNQLLFCRSRCRRRRRCLSSLKKSEEGAGAAVHRDYIACGLLPALKDLYGENRTLLNRLFSDNVQF